MSALCPSHPPLPILPLSLSPNHPAPVHLSSALLSKPACTAAISAAQLVSTDSLGNIVAGVFSRLPPPAVVMNLKCTGPGAPFPDCASNLVQHKPSAVYPACWNHNDSVVGDASCRAPSDGSRIPLCLEVAYSQSAYVVECDNAAANDPHCGVYLEVHRPGQANVLADTKLKAVFTSGFRNAIVTTTYMGDSTRVICWDNFKQGRYELWWTHRTLYNWNVERRLPFTVVSPLCDWDPLNSRFQEYATVGQAKQLVGQAAFDPARLVFTRPRPDGALLDATRGCGGGCCERRSLVLAASEKFSHPAK